MVFDFVVLGATGMQGRIVSRDLLENGFKILMCGRDKKRVESLLKRYKKSAFKSFDARDVDLTAKTVRESGAKVVVNCVEGDWNLNILLSCMKAGASCIDLGSEIWMTKAQLKLHDKMMKIGAVSITGCGSVPGVGNVMLRYSAEKFDKIDTIEVGFSWDSNIKKFVVPFSIQSIIEEFTDPAPVVERRKFIKKIPLSSIIEDYHRKIGKQKEFFVRHPETYTFYQTYKDKGLKNVRFYAGFPQHSFEKIMAMIELGFGGKEPIEFEGKKIVPVQFLTALLKNLETPKGYKEQENLWVSVKGKKHNTPRELLMECIVPTIKGWENAGCNIDTGMPASIIAQMIKSGKIKDAGSFAPEQIVPAEPFFEELAKRKMVVLENGKKIN